MRRFAVIDCEDAPKWAGHEKLWIDALAGDDASWSVARAWAGELPPADIDGVVITGSHYSVLDESLAWLRPLYDYVSRSIDDGKRVVGACFGCHVIARACGGDVARNPGARFDIGAFDITTSPELARQEWSAPLRPQLRLLGSHEDSVVACPPETVVLGRSELNPYELFVVKGAGLAIQPHPELTPALIEAKILPSLVEKGRIGAEDVPRISAGMTDLDSAPLLEAIRRFLES